MRRWQVLVPSVRSGNSGLFREFRIESLTCPSNPDTHSTDFNWSRMLTAMQPGHPNQEFHISSAGASRTRALTTGSPALYQLSYGTNIKLCIIYTIGWKVGVHNPPPAVSPLNELDISRKASMLDVTSRSNWYPNLRSLVNRWPPRRPGQWPKGRGLGCVCNPNPAPGWVWVCGHFWWRYEPRPKMHAAS